MCKIDFSKLQSKFYLYFELAVVARDDSNEVLNRVLSLKICIDTKSMLR